MVVTTSGDDILGTGLSPPAGVWIIRNNGNATFQLLFDYDDVWDFPVDFRGYRYPGLAVGLLDSDTLPDVACGGAQPPLDGFNAATHVFRNLGSMVLSGSTAWSNINLPIAWGTAVVATRIRFQGANRIDLAMSMDFGSGNTFVLLNGGGMDFSNNAVYGGKVGYGLAAARFRVGVIPIDMVTTLWSGNDARARVMFCNAQGAIASGEDYVIAHTNPPKYAWGVATGKLNNDTKEDFVVAFGEGGPWSWGAVAILVNDPNNPGDFVGSPYFFDVQPGGAPNPTFVKVADMNDDGHSDLIVSDTGTHKVSVLINGLSTNPGG